MELKELDVKNALCMAVWKNGYVCVSMRVFTLKFEERRRRPGMPVK